MIVNICGIPHKVIEHKDSFDGGHMGMIDHVLAEIYVNKDLTEEGKKETICHEIVHGILVHLGYTETSSNEQFVQAVGNAIYQAFDIKDLSKGEENGTDGTCNEE